MVSVVAVGVDAAALALSACDATVSSKISNSLATSTARRGVSLGVDVVRGESAATGEAKGNGGVLCPAVGVLVTTSRLRFALGVDKAGSGVAPLAAAAELLVGVAMAFWAATAAAMALASAFCRCIASASADRR